MYASLLRKLRSAISKFDLYNHGESVGIDERDGEKSVPEMTAVVSFTSVA